MTSSTSDTGVPMSNNTLNLEVPLAPPRAQPPVLSGQPHSPPPMEPPPPQPATSSTDMPRILTFDEFRAEANAEPPGWFWEGILPEGGVAIVGGAPYSGKTVLMSVLSAAASADGAHDAQVAGRAVLESKVLFCALEHLKHPIVENMELAQKAYGASRLQVHFLLSLDLDNDEHVQAIDQEATRLGINVIVIDCLRRATLGMENSSDDMSLVARKIKPLTANNQRLVVIIHHLGANGNLRGSTDIQAQIDSQVLIRGNSNGVRTLEATHHGAESVKMQYREERTASYLRLIEVASTPGSRASGPAGPRQEVMNAVVSFLTNSPGKSLRDIRDGVRLLGGPAQHSQIDEAIRRLQTEGRIMNTGSSARHRWEVATPAVPVPPPERPGISNSQSPTGVIPL